MEVTTAPVPLVPSHVITLLTAIIARSFQRHSQYHTLSDKSPHDRSMASASGIITHISFNRSCKAAAWGIHSLERKIQPH